MRLFAIIFELDKVLGQSTDVLISNCCPIDGFEVLRFQYPERLLDKTGAAS
jgi:hypothetical protein